MTAVPAGLIAERRIITRLMRADAMSAAQSQPLDGLSWIQQRRLRRLLNAAVISEAQPGRYYLNAPALADRMNNRRIRVAVILTVAMIVMGLAAYITTTGLRP
jgi:hypothetical protein